MQQGFRGVPDDKQAHSRAQGLLVCSRFSDVQTTDRYTTGFGFQVCSSSFSGVSDDRQTNSRVSGFRRSFGFGSRFILESAKAATVTWIRWMQINGERHQAREERVHRERVVGGDDRTGGRMPRVRQREVREAQSEKGTIWRKEEVRPGGFEEGSVKVKGPSKQTAGSRSGSTSAQAT